MDLDVPFGSGERKNEVGAELPRLPHGHPTFHAAPLRLVADRDAAGGRGFHRHNADRLAPQRRVVLLLDRREVRVHVDEQVAKWHGTPPCGRAMNERLPITSIDDDAYRYK